MIRIICVGKIKEKYLDDLIDDYKKRILKYHKIIIEEIKDSEIEEECKLILKKIKSSDYTVLFEPDGKLIDSLSFASNMDGIFIHHSDISFIIGGSSGVNQEIRNCANEIISFGKVTYPHGLFRGILLEQIYRAFKINNNERYHK